VKEYYSLAECARVLGYSNHGAISYRLFKCNFGQVFQDGTQIKLKEDKRNWIIPEDPVKAVMLAQENTNVVVRNVQTNEIVSYKTVTDASTATKVGYSTVYNRIQDNDFTPVFGYQFKNANNLTDFPNVSEEELQDSYKLNNFEIEARNLFTDEVLVFESVRKASKYFDYSNFDVPLSEKKQPLLKSGWQIKYKDDPWFDTRDFDEQVYKSQQEIMAYNEETKDIIISRDATSLGQLLKLDRKSIRKAAYTRGNQIYKGYRFRLGVTSDPWPTTQLLFKTRS